MVHLIPLADVFLLSFLFSRFSFLVLAMLLFADAAYAATWYLMAADEKVIGETRAASTMIKGSVAGPVHFVSRGEFESRSQCESDRNKLLQDWRRHSITARGGWTRHGFTTPNAFAQCVAADDPRLSKSAGATAVMDIMLQARRIR